MRPLIIIGAGDSGREILAWASPHLKNMKLMFKGFIDDGKPDVLSTITDYTPDKNDVFICSLATAFNRIKFSELLKSKGATFINLVHPTAIVLSPLSATGIIIAPFVFISNNVTIEDHVFINLSATVGHDVHIGQGSVLCAHVDLTGHVTVGANVFFGSHACVIPGKHIGDGAIVGAGSAVMRNVPPGKTVVGVPASVFI